MKNKKNDIVRDSRLERLALMIADLQEEPVLKTLEKLLAEGFSPAILLNSCLEGMRRVGKRFEQGRYFIAALIMAGEIMRRATEMLGPHLSSDKTKKTRGKFLLGTVQGDIHDLGKNLLVDMLQFDGVEVVDLGVDVEPEKFLAKTRELMPAMVGLSCVLTSCIAGLKDTVDILHQSLGKTCPPIIIGGACVDEKIREFTSADFWAADASQGLSIYRNHLRRYS
jgi:methanogenic corrinoid protein MtbC1